ncbi:MAG: DUF362 domain-containing protein [Candidatus Jordarchaeaceae archaeon]
MSLVSFVKIQKDQLKEAVQKSLEMIQFRVPNKVRNVIIKPNLCYYWDYSTGQTTDPKFVAAIIDLIREKMSVNAEISIVESDASAMKCKYAFKMLGYEKLSKGYNVKLINLSEDKNDTIKVNVGLKSFSLRVPETIKKAELRINVPKIKYTMEPIKLTCALKNIFGCNPYPKKFQYHSRLEEAIVAINKAIKFDLCIIDGIIASGIQPRKLGLVMASQDQVAIDAAAAEIAGINPQKIRYLKLAEKEGLGKTSFVPKGVPISYLRARYPRKDAKTKLMNKAYTMLTYFGLNKKLGL